MESVSNLTPSVREWDTPEEVSRGWPLQKPRWWITLSLVALCVIMGSVLQAQLVAQNDWIDSWIFMNGDAASFRNSQIAEAELEIERIRTIVELTEEHEEKLRLAVRAELTRIFREVELARVQWRGMRQDQDNWQEISKSVAPVQQKVRSGLFGPKSLFHRQLQAVLNPEMLDKLRSAEAKARQAERLVLARLFVSKLEFRIPLTEKQRTQLVEFLVEKTKSISKNATMPSYLMTCVLVTSPEEELRAFLDDEQVKVVTAWNIDREQAERILRDATKINSSLEE